MTQSEMILEALQRGEAVTPLFALQRFGCFRLGARIWDLKQAGHEIDMQLIDVGNGKHVASYSLAPKKGQLKLAV